MDVAYFLCERLQFIRQFYLNCNGAFHITKSRIENEEEPFVPPYSEDEEPPFMAEWQEAEDSLQVLGYTCLSMLSNSLKLYFTTVEQKYGFCAFNEFKTEFKKGFFAGYKAFFLNKLGINFTSAPCNLALLEEIILLRNTFEHPTDIVFHQVRHPAYQKKSQSMFFCGEDERKAWEEVKDEEGAWLMAPMAHIDKDQLFEALDNTHNFCVWFEDELREWQFPRRQK